MKFFIQDIPLYILRKDASVENEDEAYILKNANISKILEIYNRLKEGSLREFTSVIALVDDYERAMQKIKSFFELRQAAGGLVKKGDQFLCIYRLNKWDLPKGHIEKNETKYSAALREVYEETGIKCQITCFITEILHAYVSSRKNKDILKKTYWFQMMYEGNDQLKPQKNENIERALWLKEREVYNMVFLNTYEAIREVFKHYKRNSNKE